LASKSGVDWRVWHVVAGGLCTLRELQDEWNLYDLLDAHNYLTAAADMRAIPTRPTP